MLHKVLGVIASVVLLIQFNMAVMAASHEAPADVVTSHGLSAFGDLKYPKDFAHFDYVNPEAPKGGRLATLPVQGVNTFDSFNAFILKGDPAAGFSLGSSDVNSIAFDSLMTRAGDEPDALYGLVAYEVEYPEDRSWIIFRLRPEARFHDGSELTADDVVFSLNILKEKGHPIYTQNLRDVLSAEAIDPYTVRYQFAEEAEKRDLPLIVAELPIFSKAYYADREFDESTLEPPLGSGPYKTGRFELGRFVEFDRVEDYWAKDLSVNVGRWNFDTIRYEYYRDRNIGFEAFKAGAYDLREEFTSRVWATQYEFPAMQDGRAERRTLVDSTPSGVQGFFFNTRRPQLADIRVREALAMAFDFEWTNKTLFYDLYERSLSFFQGSPDLAASGPPEAGELALLDQYRDQIPDILFERAYVPPTTDASGRNRSNLRKAGAMLEDAGWEVVNGTRVNQEGVPLTLEFLMYESGFEKINAAYIKNLELLGVDADMRLVDPAQFQRLHENFEFDTVTSRYVQRLTPGVELRNFFGSMSKDTFGSRNLSGIDDPVVDALVEKVISSKSRPELTAATRALDRVLREGHYWVPQWNKPWHNIAYWNRFAWPEVEPDYQRGILDTWWSTETDTAMGDGPN